MGDKYEGQFLVVLCYDAKNQFGRNCYSVYLVNNTDYTIKHLSATKSEDYVNPRDDVYFGCEVEDDVNVRFTDIPQRSYVKVFEIDIFNNKLDTNVYRFQFGIVADGKTFNYDYEIYKKNIIMGRAEEMVPVLNKMGKILLGDTRIIHNTYGFI